VQLSAKQKGGNPIFVPHLLKGTNKVQIFHKQTGNKTK